MPAILLERLPLPSLQTYVTTSIALLAVALLYTHQNMLSIQEAAIQIPDESSRPDNILLQNIASPSPSEETEENFHAINHTLPYDSYGMNFIFVLTSEAWCIWTLVNTVYCVLILLGKLIQAIVFGELRVSEQQHLKDKFWNFVFYKFIFIFGVMNVQTMEEVVLWVAWFTGLGFLHLLTQLSKDRFEYLSFSPTTPRRSHIKLLTLLTVLLACTGTLLGACVIVGLRFGITILAFMAAECLLLGLKASYVVIRYMIHLWDLNMESVWENRSVYVYYTELIFELSSLIIDFAHHVHMLLWGNIFLSMASLVICMQLRYLFYEFQRRVKRHKNYLRVVKNMQARFPMATQEDLEHNADDCAICWERMESARRLPCGHLFHNSCLRSWLEQDTSCPTCRMTLSERPESQAASANRVAVGNIVTGNMVNPAAANQATTNHFFHFEGSRYLSWLPTVSVEVTHTNLLPSQRVQTSQLDNMLRQVQAVFPNYPQAAILEDLQQTRSVDLTIDNILEGRIMPTSTVAGLASIRDDNYNGINTLPTTETLSPSSRTAPVTLPVSVSEISSTVQQPQSSTTISSFNWQAESTQTSELRQGNTAQLPEIRSENAIDQPMHSEENFEGAVQKLGSRFSKSSSERMSMLQQRKSAMLEVARRKYLSRGSRFANGAGGDASTSTSLSLPETSFSASSPSALNDERIRLRELMLQATQRRLNNSQS